MILTLAIIWCVGWWIYLCLTTEGRIISKLVHLEDSWLTTLIMFFCAAVLVLLAPAWYPLVLVMGRLWR